MTRAQILARTAWLSVIWLPAANSQVIYYDWRETPCPNLVKAGADIARIEFKVERAGNKVLQILFYRGKQDVTARTDCVVVDQNNWRCPGPFTGVLGRQDPTRDGSTFAIDGVVRLSPSLPFGDEFYVRTRQRYDCSYVDVALGVLRLNKMDRNY